MTIKYKNVSLQYMLNTLVNCILNKTEPPIFYYRREYSSRTEEELIEITQIDLLQGRFKTIDDDFSEFEWKLVKSNIFIREE